MERAAAAQMKKGENEMRMFKIVFSGSGGELDSRTAKTEAAAAEAAIAMIEEAGELRAGDSVRVILGLEK